MMQGCRGMKMAPWGWDSRLAGCSAAVPATPKQTSCMSPCRTLPPGRVTQWAALASRTTPHSLGLGTITAFPHLPAYLDGTPGPWGRRVPGGPPPLCRQQAQSWQVGAMGSPSRQLRGNKVPGGQPSTSQERLCLGKLRAGGQDLGC